MRVPANTGLGRRLLAALALVVPLLAVLGSWLLLRDRLPVQLPSHWPGLGKPDAVTPTAVLLTIALLASGLAAVAGIVIAAWPGMSAAPRRGAFFFVGLVAGMGAATWLVSAGLSVQARDPLEAVLGGWIVLLAASAGYGIVPYLIAPRPIPAGVDRGEPLHLEPSEAGAWSRTITGSLFVWATVGLIALGGVIYAAPIIEGRAGEQLFGIVVMAAAVLVVASFIRLRVTADWRGLRIVSTVLHIPLKRIRLEQIAAVEAVDVLEPTEWGGWGYRVTPGRSALILKRGPGLVVTSTQAKQFAVTLPDPHTPAALLATLRDRVLPASRADGGTR